MHKYNAVILAAGKGTRLKPLTDNIPKALVKIGSISILEHQIRQLSHYNTRNILIVTDYLEKQIYTGMSQWLKYGLRIDLLHRKALGTVYALKTLYRVTKNNFILLFADIFTDLDFTKLFKFHLDNRADLTIVSHLSSHPWDSDLLCFDKSNNLKKIFRCPAGVEKDKYYACSGIFIMGKKIFPYIIKSRSEDFTKHLLPKIIDKKIRIKVYLSNEYIKDIGTPERLSKVINDYNRFLYTKNNSAVFIDRDGTLIKEVSLLNKVNQIEVSKNSINAIKMINKSGRLAIVVTNQSVVARGLCSEEDLNKIHYKISEIFSQNGAIINAFYYCPHHPDKGFAGENLKYKIECPCRKPNVGLINKACLDFNINLKKSWIIGDQTTDIQTGKNSGIKTILVKTGYGGRDKKIAVKSDKICNNLLTAVNYINEYR